MRHFEASNRYVVQTGLFRVEAAFSYVDFNQFLVWIRALEVSVNRCIFIIRFAEPLVNRQLGMENQFIRFEPPEALYACALDRIFYLSRESAS